MSQLTAEEAKAILLAELPSRTIHWVAPYAGEWYICATDPTDPDEGDLNPYFKVNASNGSLTEFYVVANLTLFAKIRAQAELQTQ